MTDNKTYQHDKGGKDASEGKYDPPHGADIFTWSEDALKEHAEETEAYDEGHRNTKGQIGKD